MMNRRDLVTGGVLGGVFGAAPSPAHATTGLDTTVDLSTEAVAKAIVELRDELQSQRTFPEIAALRTAQKSYLRSNGKLPDFIDVGADVWFNAYDWHVRWQQPMTLGRDASGRYTIALLNTAMVLRHDTAPGFIGLPYDNR